jgi:RHH-type proline utilization regulon transcriptional repressor/proline dehydrogenase/delta 1-pyrroline-5-carboxylate dehydrogenase
MLGEAALTAADAALSSTPTRRPSPGSRARRVGRRGPKPRHLHQALGAVSALRGPAARPRHGRACAARQQLVHAARDAGIGISIDAEEADRLDLSLDVIEAVARDPHLAGWDGFGVVVQAYSRRAGAVIDWLARWRPRSIGA